MKDEDLDVNRQSKDGKTALMYCGNIDILAQLLKLDKIIVSHQDNHGDTALALANIIGHFDAAGLLLKHDKVNVNRQTGSSPLIMDTDMVAQLCVESRTWISIKPQY